MFDYALKSDDYTWEKALLWGNFLGHCNKVKEESSFQGRLIHVLIAAIELLPIISQISSIFEMIIVNHFRTTQQQEGNLSNKPIEEITQEVKDQNHKNISDKPAEDKKPEILDPKEKIDRVEEPKDPKKEAVIPTQVPKADLVVPTQEPKADPTISPIFPASHTEVVAKPGDSPSRDPMIINQAAKVENVVKGLISEEKYEPFQWEDMLKYRVSCGDKHDQLTKIEKILLPGMVPKFFGFEHEQITSLFSDKTKKLWEELQTKEISSLEANSQIFEDLQKSVEDDIVKSALPLEDWQLKALKDLKHTQTTLIVRSSSNEDALVVNARGNETVSGVFPTEESLKTALAKVVSSYFSLKSFKNRAAFENPLLKLPLCSVLIMEQITETPGSPIVSGVMRTNELTWSSSGEEGITHITASWGFGNGTSGKVSCDEWAITEGSTYSTIRRKLYRTVPTMLGKEEKVVNNQSLRETPSLSEKQLNQLQGIAETLESSYGKAMNVEFVIKDENLYVIQARSIQSSPLSLNPTRLISTSDRGNSFQEKSDHPSILKLQDFLATTPEVLKDRFDEIENTICEFEVEITGRSAFLTGKLSMPILCIMEKVVLILECMRSAITSNQMTQLAFHAGMLRQLISQSGKEVIGAHSLSGLEVATNLPAHIDKFIKTECFSLTAITESSLKDLALFGIYGFDQQVQSNWLKFLKTQRKSNLLEKLNRELEVLTSLELVTNWLSENFSGSQFPTMGVLISKLEKENKINLDLVHLKAEIGEISEKLNRKQIGSKEEFEELCEQMQKISNEFIEHCSKNKCKHPLIVDLIDLWNLSTKAVKTLKLYEDWEEDSHFKKRVDAFSQFAVNASKANLLNYLLEDFVENVMLRAGKEERKFPWNIG